MINTYEYYIQAGEFRLRAGAASGFERVRNGVRPKAMRRFFDDWQGHVDEGLRRRDGAQEGIPEPPGVHFR